MLCSGPRAGPYRPVGCYKDSEQRVMTQLYSNVSAYRGMTTLQQCYKAAAAANYAYFAVEVGRECYGSNVLSQATALGPATCDIACAGRGACGGAWALTLYEITGP